MVKKYKARIKFLSRDEVDRVIANAKSLRDKAMMTALFSTGLRIAECIALTREDIEKAQGEQTKEVSIVGKGGYQRVVFFSPVALEVIGAYLDERKDRDVRLFPITKRQAERIVKECALKAGVHATPHTFRHSLATHLLRQGANIRIVQEMLGHRSINSTQIYAGCTNSDLMEAHKKFLD